MIDGFPGLLSNSKSPQGRVASGGFARALSEQSGAALIIALALPGESAPFAHRRTGKLGFRCGPFGSITSALGKKAVPLNLTTYSAIHCQFYPVPSWPSCS